MNSKRAKGIRRFLRNRGIDVTQAEYEKINEHTVTAVVGSHFDEHGDLVEDVMTTTAHTAMLVKGCGRQLYMSLKRAALKAQQE